VYFLFGKNSILPYKVLWVIIVFFGAISELKFVWTFSDIMNGLMAFPNLVALIALSGILAKKTREYFQNN